MVIKIFPYAFGVILTSLRWNDDRLAEVDWVPVKLIVVVLRSATDLLISRSGLRLHVERVLGGHSQILHCHGVLFGAPEKNGTIWKFIFFKQFSNGSPKSPAILRIVRQSFGPAPMGSPVLHLAVVHVEGPLPTTSTSCLVLPALLIISFTSTAQRFHLPGEVDRFVVGLTG